MLLISVVRPNAIKEALLAQAIMSAPQLPVVVLLDGTQEEYRRYGYAINKRWRHRSVYLKSSYAPKDETMQSYNTSNVGGWTADSPFNGCPGKLEAAQWCAASGYDFCWHMEDDVYVHNMHALELAYRSNSVDLLPHGLSTGHPFWVSAPPGARSGWGWTNRSHLLLHAPRDTPRFCALAIYRMSRAFAQSLTRTLLDEGSGSMCEIWYPYVIYKHPHLSMGSMQRKHLPGAETMTLNAGQPCHLFQGLHEVQDRHDFMAHPIKYFKRVSTPARTETTEQCHARAQREHADEARQGKDRPTRAPTPRPTGSFTTIPSRAASSPPATPSMWALWVPTPDEG